MINAQERHNAAKQALVEHGSIRKAAASLNIAPSTFQGWMKEPKAGNLKTPPREVRELPAKGANKVYILTSAQNNTGLHEKAWASLQTLAELDCAEIIAARVTYATNSRASVGQKTGHDAAKRKTSQEGGTGVREKWDERLDPFFHDYSIELAPGLVWCGELQILPTAIDPISGLEAYTGRASAIVPHAKFAMKSIPSPKMRGTKLVYTTGTVTLRNYIEKKTGQRASFHHGYGAVIVEVTDDGSWFVRQLNADSDGVIYDLDRCVNGKKVTFGNRPEALVWGDIHARQLEVPMRELGWGKGGILETLKPKRQIMHDVLDFRSQNHHDRKDPWKTFAKHCDIKLSVEDEFNELGEFLNYATRPWCETVIAAANHDEAFIRWLKEADYREDPLNAELILEATWVAYRAMRAKNKSFYAVQWAAERSTRLGQYDNTKWLRRDQEYVVCDDANGGIQLDMHGDKGSNGAKGQIKQFARSGRKCVVADSHVAGIHEGAFQVGVMGSLDQEYNQGSSSWSHTNCIVYANGKRTLITVWKGRWHGRVERKTQRKFFT